MTPSSIDKLVTRAEALDLRPGGLNLKCDARLLTSRLDPAVQLHSHWTSSFDEVWAANSFKLFERKQFQWSVYARRAAIGNRLLTTETPQAWGRNLHAGGAMSTPRQHGQVRSSDGRNTGGQANALSVCLENATIAAMMLQGQFNQPKICGKCPMIVTWQLMLSVFTKQLSCGVA
ncbi:hypothetical protein RRG08_007947 [Elysia crispata]|uniref:Uncharacterized protein n=1 Tax=Elysia crispata TaxID=231223 RepID=A0AAE1DKT4_9GAST|nr:hypothetical protein RRG08_007947 [Elysia crispata]